MQGKFWLVKTPEEISERCLNFARYLRDDYQGGWPICWQAKKYTQTRSLSQNALSHLWYRQMAEHFDFQGEGNVSPEAQAKLVCKSMFLGVKDITIGKLVIRDQLIPTSGMEAGEFHDYLTQIQEWAGRHGLALASQGEYLELQKSQNGQN